MGAHSGNRRLGVRAVQIEVDVAVELCEADLAGHLRAPRPEHPADIENASQLDRGLLAVGGRAWLERRFLDVLRRLAERFSEGKGTTPDRTDDASRA